MAQPPILSLSDIRLSFGGKPLFEGVEFSLNKGDRAALVGRNGAGKSTLMKIVDGRLDPDLGDIWLQPGTRIVTVEQEPDMSAFETLLDFAMNHPVRETQSVAHVDITIDHHRAEAELMEMALDPQANPRNISGGQQRRAALARAFATDPDILLLDEPTNHLDVPMINMIETRIKAFRGAVLLVSHDRRFLESVSTNTLWLRQGIVRKSPRGYAHFESWASEIEAEEERTLARMKTQLKDEKRWLARGVTGRRKRNMGRLGRLNEMRAEHARRRSALGDARSAAALNAETADTASRKIIDVRGISKSFNADTASPITIADSFSIRVLRGDRIGIIGPNGAGKTTLLKLMLKELAPDSGSVKLTKTIKVNFLDQTRETLNPKDTIWETLAPNGGDSIMVQDTSRHVAGYAKDFLFDPMQLRQPVSALSGGERNRLTLAVALAKKCDLLVLDEPTNDLDMQTLDLLEDMLEQYSGTLLIVSHDRAFLDNTVTSCLCPMGQGKWIQTAGGWSDAQEQLAQLAPAQKDSVAKSKAKRDNRTKNTKPTSKLSFKDSHKLKELDKAIPNLTAEIASLETELANPTLYAEDQARFNTLSLRLETARDELETAEMEWLELEEKRETIEGNHL